MKKSDVVRKALENWRKGIYAEGGICRCLKHTQWNLLEEENVRADWYSIIGDMLGDDWYVSEWLNKRGIYPTKSELREYRELWLEHLLNYYLEQGD